MASCMSFVQNAVIFSAMHQAASVVFFIINSFATLVSFVIQVVQMLKVGSGAVVHVF